TVADVRSNTDLDILVLDTETGEHTNTTAHEGDVVFAPGPWAHDNSGFYLVTNQGREYNGLAFYTLASKSWAWVESPDHDIEGVGLSQDGKILIWIVNEDGRSRLYGRDLSTNSPLKLPDLPLGVVAGMDVSPDGSRIALIFARPGQAAC